MCRVSLIAAAGLALTACGTGQDEVSVKASGAPGCIADDSGSLQARLRGAVTADVEWRNADMQCAGDLRPDNSGMRLTFAGTLPGDAGAPVRRLRFIFGVDHEDTAAGVAQALPTNITVIFEGEQQMYATQGKERCAVELLERTPIVGGSGKLERVHARGYCVDPATSMAGESSLLVPTFDFTGVVNTEAQQ
jgi:hypothetical protein